MTTASSFDDPRPSVRTLLADPTVRAPLKSVLRLWIDRDPVDAVQDANLLALALERLADERCGQLIGLGRSSRQDGGIDDGRSN